MSSPLAILALCASPLTSSPHDATEGPWIADFDQAVTAARTQEKDLLVDFTGSDWCGWCIRLDEEVFSHEEFLQGIQEDFVLVKLDYPRGDEAKEKVPNPERNEELSEKYDITGFPTILLMNSDGDVYGQTGYQQGGPAAYLTHLSELRTSGRKELEKVLALVASFEAAAEEDKAQLLGEVLDTLEGLGDKPFASRLAEPARCALELDPENKEGLKLRAVSILLTMGLADEEILAAATELDPKNELGLQELVLQFHFGEVRDDVSANAFCDALEAFDKLGKITDEEQIFELFFYAAYWNNGPLENPERAVNFARRALEIGTPDERQAELLDEILAEEG